MKYILSMLFIIYHKEALGRARNKANNMALSSRNECSVVMNGWIVDEENFTLWGSGLRKDTKLGEKERVAHGDQIFPKNKMYHVQASTLRDGKHSSELIGSMLTSNWRRPPPGLQRPRGDLQWCICLNAACNVACA